MNGSDPHATPVLASRRVLWALIAVTYLCATAGGVAVLGYPPRSYVGGLAVLTFAWGIILTGSAGAAAVGVIARHRLGYVLEWAACYVLAIGFVIYGVLSWWTVPDSLGNMPRAFIITGCVTAALARGTFLALEDWTARQAALARRKGVANE